MSRGPPRAARILAGGMAEAANMKSGDILRSLDDLPVGTRADLQVALRCAGGDGDVKIGFERDGKTIVESVPAVRVASDSGVHYDAIERDGVRLRTMIGRPTGSGRRPAIAFLQGLSLATMDLAFPELFRAFSDEGFVTMRVEKRGVGDSEGVAPELGDLATEVADAHAAVLALSQYDFVDPEAVFVLGHSVGGMLAPKLGVEDRVRGFLTYGSSAEPWFDCLEATARRQFVMRGTEDVERHVSAFREELQAKDVMDGRSAAYHRELHEAEVAQAWSRVRRPVLVLHGAYDWVVSEDESRRIAQLARGTFRTVPRLDHLFSAHDSVEASAACYGKGAFEPEIVRESCAWMRDVMKAV